MILHRLRWRLPVCICMLLVLCGSAAAAMTDTSPIPTLSHHVTDTTQTLSPRTRVALEQQLTTLTAEKGAEVALLLIPTTAGEPIEDYAQRAFEHWRLGRKGVDDGVLVVVATQDHHLRIHVGYGLEGTITDLQAKQISRTYLTPAFKRGDYDGGLTQGIQALIGLIRGDTTLPEVAGKELPYGLVALPALLADIIVMPFITRWLRKKWRFPWLSGPKLSIVLATGVAWIGFWLMGVPLGIMLALVFFVALATWLSDQLHFDDPPRPKTRQRQGLGASVRDSAAGYSSNDFGSSWSSSDSSSSDSFSGGGGDSGGGGSSDSW